MSLCLKPLSVMVNLSLSPPIQFLVLIYILSHYCSLYDLFVFDCIYFWKIGEKKFVFIEWHVLVLNSILSNGDIMGKILFLFSESKFKIVFFFYLVWK